MKVLDASVVIKWFKPDEHSIVAEQFLNEHLAGRESIFVPSLLLYEVTNALWCSRRLTSVDVDYIISLLMEFRLTYVNPDEELLHDALIISEKASLSIYDSSYIALAKRLDCQLVTADRKLAKNAQTFAKIFLLSK